MKAKWLLKLLSALIAIMVVTGCNDDDADNEVNDQEEVQPGEDTNEDAVDDENDAVDDENDGVPDEEEAVEDPEDVNDADNVDE
ncbi:hypothetical protein [Anoxybacillus kestanbolensis]|uniref:hypothetical protein n=1 Tax=Anoxybacillus kestanbolensis TaxID=227476 RepID=UPI003D1D8220